MISEYFILSKQCGGDGPSGGSGPQRQSGQAVNHRIGCRCKCLVQLIIWAHVCQCSSAQLVADVCCFAACIL